MTHLHIVFELRKFQKVLSMLTLARGVQILDYLLFFVLKIALILINCFNLLTQVEILVKVWGVYRKAKILEDYQD